MKQDFSRKKVAILFGGRSEEHEISIKSAINIIRAVNKNKYEIYPIYLSKNGKWILIQDIDNIIDVKFKRGQYLCDDGREVYISTNANVCFCDANFDEINIDVAFPVLHGPYGEDGTIQGLLEMYGVPYAGSTVLSSSLCMDKDFTKRILKHEGIPVCEFKAFKVEDDIDLDLLENLFNFPMFVKPSRLGSSIGISKVHTKAELISAIKLSFTHDTKILVEKYIKGRELECAVLVDHIAIASCIGEIIPNHSFYSYESKYLDSNGAKLCIPADIPNDLSVSLQEMAVKVFTLLECKNLARVDFFVDADSRIYVNEVNTMPGFTNISMFSKLWTESGVPYAEQIHIILDSVLNERSDIVGARSQAYLG